MAEQDDVDAQFRRLVASIDTDLAPTGRPSRESRREVRREARERARRRRGPRRWPRHLRTALALAATAALVVVGVRLGYRPWLLTDPGSAQTDAAASPTPADRRAPTPGHEEAAARLLPAPVARDVPGGYRFMFDEPGTADPVTYDPCRPIHYVVNPAHEPAGGAAILADALARVSSATGLRFVDDGTSTETASLDRDVYQPTRYGDRWAPVLVAWPTGQEQPDFVGNAIGEAGSEYVETSDGHRVYVTGTVQLDSDWFTQVLARRHGAAVAESVVLHELGHLVGLAHVADRTQIMFAMETPSTTAYGAGDLAGLARVGSGACAPQV